MIDVHCHILPGYDDGSANIAESMAMARMALSSGVTGIVATPHFRGEPRSLQDVTRLVSKLRWLDESIRDAGLPLTLYPGAEVLCLPQSVEMARRRELPTLGDTDYVLTEFYFNEPFDYMDAVLSGIGATGYRPVVAHPERYEEIQRDPRLVEGWIRKGYVIQLNKGSILGAFGSQEELTANWLLDEGMAHIVASDGHGADRRTTDMAPLRANLLRKCDPAYVQALTQSNPQLLLQGAELRL